MTQRVYGLLYRWPIVTNPLSWTVTEIGPYAAMPQSFVILV